MLSKLQSDLRFIYFSLKKHPGESTTRDTIGPNKPYMEENHSRNITSPATGQWENKEESKAETCAN